MGCPRSSRLRSHIDAASVRPLLVASLALLLAASLVQAAPLDDVRVDVLFKSVNFFPSSLIQARNGLFYGAGSTEGYGLVFRVTPSGAVTVLHQFEFGDVGDRFNLVEGADGNLYGTISHAGPSLGAVFRMTPTGEVTTLHDFSGPDGAYPGSLIQARNGVLYGVAVTGQGGTSVYWLTTDGVFGTLAS